MRSEQEATNEEPRDSATTGKRQRATMPRVLAEGAALGQRADDAGRPDEWNGAGGILAVRQVLWAGWEAPAG